jgi:hypothetical protein
MTASCVQPLRTSQPQRVPDMAVVSLRFILSAASMHRMVEEWIASARLLISTKWLL